MMKGFLTDNMTSVLLKNGASAAESLAAVPLSFFSEAAFFGYAVNGGTAASSKLTLQVKYGSDDPIDLPIEHLKVCADTAASALYTDGTIEADGTVDLPATVNKTVGFVIEIPENTLGSVLATKSDPPTLILKTTEGTGQSLIVMCGLWGGVYKGQKIDPLA